VANCHQASQRAVLPSITPSHENGKLAAVDDHARRQTVGSRRERRPRPSIGKQQLIERGGITHPKPVGKDLNQGLGAKADRASQPATTKAHTRRRELGLGPDPPSVNRDLERPVAATATAQKGSVFQHRPAHSLPEIRFGQRSFDDHLGTRSDFRCFANHPLELTIEPYLPPVAIGGA